MGRWRKLAVNTALLTGSSLVMHCIALSYQVWLVGKIGSAGIGLFQLIVSINVLCVTFAVSGVKFTTTRLVSEEIGAGNERGVGSAMSRCIGYAVIFGCLSCLALFLAAEPIGFLWIGDARCVLSLKIIAFGLPFIALSSVLNGYFVATGRVYKAAVIQVIEQLCNIGFVVFLLSRAADGELEQSCSAIALGGVGSDIVSFLLVLVVYLSDRKKHASKSGARGKITGRMLKIAVPLALSAYARTSLTTLENLLVPRSLKASGLGADQSLSGYGTITGMVFPIISFPSCFLSALSELMVPDLTAAQVCGDKDYIGRTVSALLRASFFFSLVTAAFLFATAEALGAFIYKDPGIGYYIKIFALLAPIMYMDIVTDGCLKGLGQMMHSMTFNITEATIGVILVVTLIPVFGLRGYIFVLFICELYNFTMSIARLRKVTKIEIFPRRRRGAQKCAPCQNECHD